MALLIVRTASIGRESYANTLHSVAAGLPWLTFHGLRHGFGSLLAANGVHPRVAMEMMGHSEIRTTMQIYTHSTPELAHEAARSINAALGVG